MANEKVATIKLYPADPSKYKDLWEKWDLYVENAPEYKVKI